MKIMVIYDSTFGNTKTIADTIAKELGNDVQALSVSDLKENSLDGIEFLVVGSPIIAWKPSERMGMFLSNIPQGRLKGVKAAAFDTRVKLFIHGDAVEKIALALTEAGAEMIGESNMFYVKGKEGPLYKGETEKAIQWAKKLRSIMR